MATDCFFKVYLAGKQLAVALLTRELSNLF